MKVFMTGGTGFVGKTLTRYLIEQGHQVTVLTRKIPVNRTLSQGVSLLEGDPTKRGEWQRTVTQHEIIVNLAGASVFRKWDKKTKEIIRESRVLTTTNLVEALSDGVEKETTLISTSAVGYYGSRNDAILTEEASAGKDFLAQVCVDWEKEALKAEEFGVRVVLVRTGVVLGNDGGALAQMLLPLRLGLGGRLGKGDQYMSWIHINDLVNIIIHAGEAGTLSGPINAVAPNPVSNAVFTKALADVLHRPAILPAPGFALKLALGEFANVLLGSQRAVPQVLEESGYTFAFPLLKDAFSDLLA